MAGALEREEVAGAEGGFSEREFYLQEFRDRTLAIACPGALVADAAPLAAVTATLARHGSRVVLISSRRRALEAAVGDRVLAATAPRLETSVWRALRRARRAGIVAGGRRSFAVQCRELALRLRVSKLVWIDRGGGVRARDGGRLSFVHQDELRELLARPVRRGRPRTTLLREIDALLSAGIEAVNVCTLDGLEQELFTYAGSGTLFTRRRYIEVRDLGLDDFDAAADLIARGVEEGFLAGRPAREVDRILAEGFGAFVEGRHLAGIGALLVYGSSRQGEIASLYTLTRFLGEGVGAHLVAFALARARALRLKAVFACTTLERVGAFFLRQGFEAVEPGALPAGKWRGYDRTRRHRIRCYRKAVRTRRA